MLNKIKQSPKCVLNLFLEYKLPILAGVLQATSYIPFPPWGLFFCLVPLWFFWIKSDLKKIVVGTLVCAFVASLIGFHWITITIHDFGKLPWSVSILGLTAFSLIANIYLVFAAITWSLLSLLIDRRIGLWLIPFITALFITFFPALFPWNFGYAWIYANLPGAQLSDIFGVVSLATATVLINFLVFMALKEKKYVSYGLSALVFFIGLNALGILRLNYLPKEEQSVRVMIVQANIGNLEKQKSMSGYNFREKVITKYINLSNKTLAQSKELSSIAPVDLVVWPETAYPSYVDTSDIENSAPILYRFAYENAVALATGFYDIENSDRVANAILYIDNKGQVAARPTHKTILLAFGEYLPGSDWFPGLKKVLPQVADFIRGPGPEVRNLNDINLGPLICYESLYPWFTRDLANQKANIILNVTNDSWYDDRFEPLQHLYITAGRALENRRPLIRSTNTGLSTVIKSDGQPMAISPRSKEWTGVYNVSYPDKNYQTIYQKWGRNFHHLALLFTTLTLIIIGRLKKTI
jgi:apolipoprotein N-acyltransferase